MPLVEQTSHASTAPDYFGDVYRRVAARLEAADFSGADPFDGLNSRVFAKLPFSSLPIARLAWLQLFKKSPYDFRALAKVPPSTNPVTLALAARTYALTGEHEKMRRTIERLVDMRSERGGHGAWGYPFPWQAKAFYVARGVPNVIATAYAVRAVSDCGTSGKPAHHHGCCRFRRHGTRLSKCKRRALHRLRAAKRHDGP